jgi:RNA polymerase sigma-70 factor, ECF subfamily
VCGTKAAEGAGIMAITLDAQTFDHVQPVLMGYARRAVRDDDLAADLVQETWAATAKHLHTYDGRASLRSWMVGILKHKLVDHFRRTARERPLDDSADPVAPDQDRDNHLDRERALEHVRRELEALPELQRRAVELCDVQGMDRDAAADVLGVERGHLRVLLHRGRHKLRTALEQSGITAVPASAR